MSSPPAFAQRSAAGYAGSATFSLFPALADSIAGMSPLIVDPSATVTLSGPGLAPADFTARLLYKSKFGGDASVNATLTSGSVDKIGNFSSSLATFLAPRDAQPDSMV